ncbi:MAG: hypothetical protein ACK5LN_02640 [Propioniciclava sp.]
MLFVLAFRPPISLMGWGTTVLWVAWLVALIAGGLGGDSPLLAAILPTLGTVACGSLGFLILVWPSEVLFVIQETQYGWLRVVGGVGAAAAGAALAIRLRRGTLAPLASRPEFGAAGVAPRLRVSLVDQIRDQVVARIAVGVRLGGTALVILLGTLLVVVGAGGAFLPAWLALLVVLVLGLEMCWYRWAGQELAAGLPGLDPVRGSTKFDGWWSVTWALAVVITGRASAYAGGLRPEPIGWYLLLALVVLLAGWLPFPLLWRRRDHVFTAWLLRRPERYRELVELRARVSPAEFGRWPDVG